MQPVPKPHRDPLQRRVFQPLHVVQHPVIERIARFRNRGFKFGEVKDDPGVLIELPIHGDARAE